MCIAVNVARVKGQIAEACARVGRNLNEVRLLAVTKYATDDQVDRLIAAGVHTLGENRVQQAVERMERFGCHDVEWHLIGSLQTNKVKYCRNFSLIHSLDRWRLAEELEKRASQWGKRQDVLVQVNISGEMQNMV